MRASCAAPPSPTSPAPRSSSVAPDHPGLELAQGHAAAPGGQILEQALQMLVEGLDSGGAAEHRAAARHQLRGMERELDMPRAAAPGELGRAQTAIRAGR